MASSIADKLNDLHREVMGLGVERLVSEARGDPKYVKLETVRVPSGKLVEEATKFAHETLDEAVFNHSLRTYFYGAIIGAEQYPKWEWDPETLYLASILHDVGLTKRNIDNTVLSFEYDGALQAYEFLVKNGAEKKKTEIVFEAVARHSDLYIDGKRPEAFLVSMGAGMDVAGMFGQLLHRDSLHEIVTKYPRLDLNTLSAQLMQYEMESKNKQCHTKCYLDMGLLHMMQNNPLFASTPN